MRHPRSSIAVALISLGFLASGVSTSGTQSDSLVTRGEYLVDVIGCGECHTPRKAGSLEPDDERFLSGHSEGQELAAPQDNSGDWNISSASFTAWSGPWGVSYAVNLTPDENTGMGSWAEGTFVDAMKTGMHMGVARTILPPMPWASYRRLSDSDLRAIYAYLRSIPPIRNRVPEPVLVEGWEAQ